MALRKVETLVSRGADVVVVAREIAPEIEVIPGVEVRRRPYEPSDLDCAILVIAATDDRSVNERVHADARSAGVLVNVVDVPELCDFIVPASVVRGPPLASSARGYWSARESGRSLGFR